MLPVVIAAAVVAAFHVIPTPDDVKATSAFSIQGFVSESDHTILEAPAFDPETEKLRPSAKITFVPPATGVCVVAETETIDGETTYTVNDRIMATQGERVFRRVVLLTADDLAGDSWQDSVRHRYRFVVACRKDDAFVWSSFYEVPVDVPVPPAPPVKT
jgi:hypothetical protein